jgi:hypothetical protein
MLLGNEVTQIATELKKREPQSISEFSLWLSKFFSAAGVPGALCVTSFPKTSFTYTIKLLILNSNTNFKT